MNIENVGQLQKIIAAAASNFVLTPESIQIREWDRSLPINGIAAPAVIAALVDPYGRPVPETRAVEMRVLELDVVVVLQRCHPVTNAPLYSDADVAQVVAWMRDELLPTMCADRHKFAASLNAALAKRIFEEARADRGTP